MSVLRTFTVRDLMKMGKRLDRVAKERAEEATTPTAEQRADALELQNRRPRQLLRRNPSA